MACNEFGGSPSIYLEVKNLVLDILQSGMLQHRDAYLSVLKIPVLMDKFTC